MASIKDNMEQLEELFRQDGGGYLLIGYETGMDKPHAAISYQLYPVNPDQDGMTYQFLSLLHVGMETARISAFVPDTRLLPLYVRCPFHIPGHPREGIHHRQTAAPYPKVRPGTGGERQPA